MTRKNNTPPRREAAGCKGTEQSSVSVRDTRSSRLIQGDAPLYHVPDLEQRRECALADLRELREWHRWQASLVEAIGIGLRNHKVSVAEVERFLSFDQEGSA